jgi:serine protease Do
MKRNKVLLVIVVNVLITCCIITIALHNVKRYQSYEVSQPSAFSFAKHYQGMQVADETVDLTGAASLALNALVQIRTRLPSVIDTTKNNNADGFISDMLGGINPAQPAEQRSSGSGVIISDDGYIVTNEHVLANGKGIIAGEVDVTLSNKKIYKAKLVGHDAASDIAVLKIDADNIPYLVYCHSKTIQPGQWVLAAGYPLLLTATVTAGIISATGVRVVKKIGNRNIVQTFIQTDAAANSGNSGGALVNADGELIGIMTGIITTTGSYSGYSFAIPVNVVKRVVEKIMN